MKKYLKVSLILIAILTVYSIIVFAIANNENDQKDNENNIVDKNNNDKQNNDNNENKDDDSSDSDDNKEEVKADYNIIMSPNTLVSYTNGVWKENKDYKYTNQLFDVYVNMEAKGKMFLTYNNEWHIYDENRDFLEYSGDIFAINTTKEYQLRNVVSEDLNANDKNIITALLTSESITHNYDDMLKYKFTYDINSDGTKDDIYFVSNAFTENEDQYNKAFSMGFVKFANSTEIFYEDIRNTDGIYTICNPYLQNIIELNNSLYFITGCTYFNNNGTEHYIYSTTGTTIKEELKTSINK